MPGLMFGHAQQQNSTCFRVLEGDSERQGCAGLGPTSTYRFALPSRVFLRGAETLSLGWTERKGAAGFRKKTARNRSHHAQKITLRANCVL